MGERVEIDIIANVTKAVSGLEKLVKQLAATYLGYRALKDFLVSSIKEALEAERAYVALGSAMRSSGQNAEVYTKQLAGLARALSMTTTFAEEETMAAMQSLTQIGRVSAEGMKRVIPVVQDLAAGLGIDLNAAALLVGKAIEGNTGALGRYGIKIKETSDPAERFSAIIAGLTERFGGMSEAMARSASGGLKQIKNEFNELKEAVGNRLIQAFAGTITWLSSRMQTNVILGMKAADIGSIEEGSVYLKTLRREMETDQKWIKDLEAQWGFKIDPTKKYSSRSGGDALGDTFKRIAELQNKIDGIKRQMAKLGQTQGTGIGPLLPGVSDDAADKIKKIELNSLAFADALNRLQGQESNYIITTWKAGQATYDFDEALKRLGSTTAETGKEVYKNMNQYLVYTASYDSDIDSAQKLQEKIKETYEWMQKTADAAISIGTSLAAGDTQGAFQKIISESMGLLIQFALMAAAKAYAIGDYANMALWLGVAGVAVVGQIAGNMIGSDSGDKNIPAYGNGGIVTRPTLALVGESGPEAIVPLGRGGGGNTIIVQGSIWAARDLARELAAIQGRW